MITVGVDIGGTKVAAGLVDDDGTVLHEVRRRTPHRTTEPEVVEATIVEAVRELMAMQPVSGVGIGAAGFVSAQTGMVLFAPHLSWRNEPLRDAVQQQTGVPVVVDNDANAALWAESRFGAARGEPNVLMVNLGTGIGGALLVEGRLMRGRFGLAGEFGHMQVVPGGRLCECGNRGCWEQYASGNALARAGRELAETGGPPAQRLREHVGVEADALTGPAISEVAATGDPAAIELLEEVGRWLGVGIASLVAAFDPGRVVIGGGVSEVGDLLLRPAREAFRRNLTGRGFRPEPEIVPAALGNRAGLIGAADLARALP